MLIQALRCGVPYLLFWNLTPKEVYYFIEAENLNTESKHFISVQNARLSALCYRAKKIPTMEKLIGKMSFKKKVKVQSLESMLRIVEFANKQFGGRDLRKK